MRGTGKCRGRTFYGMGSFLTKHGFVQLQDVVSMLARPEIEPDEGWCAHTFGFEIRQGSSDGVDLSGTTVAFTGEWPANFFLGGGKARLYIVCRPRVLGQ